MAAWGLQIGDVVADRAIVWSRADKPARMLVEWSTREDLSRAVMLRGPYALEGSDFTSRIDLTGLPADQEVFVRVTYENLDNGKARSEPVLGRFRTAPLASRRRRDVRFLWSGDTAGQGWGINPDVRRHEDLRGDAADRSRISSSTPATPSTPTAPMVEQPATPDGSIWVNAFLDAVPEKLKVAETQHEFHRNYLYNRYDENVQALQRRGAAGLAMGRPRGGEQLVGQQGSVGRSALHREARAYPGCARHPGLPRLRADALDDQDESERVYRHIPYGADLDVFVVDMRSYRGPNSVNLQARRDRTPSSSGASQIEWLKRKLTHRARPGR